MGSSLSLACRTINNLFRLEDTESLRSRSLSIFWEKKMSKKIKSGLLSGAIVLMLCLSSSAGAVGLMFAKHSAERYFTDDDWALLQETGQRLLREVPDHQLVDWKNDKTGHSGTMWAEAFGSYEGKPCRRAYLVNRANKRADSSDIVMCEINEDTWKIVSESQLDGIEE